MTQVRVSLSGKYSEYSFTTQVTPAYTRTNLLKTNVARLLLVTNGMKVSSKSVAVVGMLFRSRSPHEMQSIATKYCHHSALTACTSCCTERREVQARICACVDYGSLQCSCLKCGITVVMYACPLCRNFSAISYGRVLSHVEEIHQSEPGFKMCCHFCPQTYTKVSGYR